MADTEVTVASIDAELAEQIVAIEAAMPDNMDEVNRLVMLRAPLLAKKARLVLTENKVAIAAETDSFKAAIAELVASSTLSDAIGEPITKFSVFIEEGVTYLNINPKNLKRLPAKRGAVAKTGVDSEDKVFRVINGEREELSIGAMVQTYASDEVKATSVWEKGAWSTLYPKVNDDLGPLAFTLVPSAAPANAPAA